MYKSLVLQDLNFAKLSHVTTFGVGCTLNTAGRHLNFAKVLRSETATNDESFTNPKFRKRFLDPRAHPNFEKHFAKLWSRVTL